MKAMNRRRIRMQKLARKGAGKEAKLSYQGNLLIENGNGLIVDATAWEANGRAERDAALAMLEQIPGEQQVTVGADKNYDTKDFVAECRHLHVTPHVAQNEGRRGGSAIDGRTTRHAGYGVSQRKRKRIEECFGWLKTIALLRKVRHRGMLKVDWVFRTSGDSSSVSWRPKCVCKSFTDHFGTQRSRFKSYFFHLNRQKVEEVL